MHFHSLGDPEQLFKQYWYLVRPVGIDRLPSLTSRQVLNQDGHQTRVIHNVGSHCLPRFSLALVQPRLLVIRNYMIDQYKKTALIDVLAVLATLVVVKQVLLPFSQLLAGPASTTSAMVVATALLWRRQRTWHELGMRWRVGVKSSVIYTALAFFVIIITATLSKELATHLFGVKTGSGRFDFVVGNPYGYLLVMALVWTHSAIFEEMLFRAFLIGRGSEILGGGRWAGVIVLITMSVFFGYRHFYYQGLHGALVTGAIGCSIGIMYLWFGRRNLLPLIIAHGLVNSISQTQRFLGV